VGLFGRSLRLTRMSREANPWPAWVLETRDEFVDDLRSWL
jgi:hypothetical protein